MDLKEMLLKEGIVKIRSKDEESFTLKSGKKSRLFIDIKEASLNPIILGEIADEILVILNLRRLCPDKIASVAVGGVPIASVVSYILGMPQIIVRSEKHDRGTKSQIIGNCKGKHIVLIEDVATSGGSIISAVKAIREAGGVCNTCIVIVDRQEGAKRSCEENDIVLISVLTKSDFGVMEEI